MPTLFKKLSLVLALVFAFAFAAPAQEAAETGAVKVSWEEFKKLLDLGKDEIVLSWAEFQQIIAQTDTKIVPAFELRDEKVVLTRAQFRNLLEKMKPPHPGRRRAAGGVAAAAIGLQGPAGRRRGAHRGRHLRRCLPRDPRRLRQPPPVPGADRRPRYPAQRPPGPDRNQGRTLHGRDGQGGTAPDRRGSRPAGDRGPGPGDILPRSPDADHHPRVRPPPPRARGRGPGRPAARGLGPEQRHPCLRRPDPDRNDLPQMAEKIAEAPAGPAKVYADTLTLISVEEDAVRISAEIALAVLQNTIPSLVLRVPEGYSILDVRGPGVGDWRELARKDETYLEVPFDFPKKGNFALSVAAERILPHAAQAAGYAGFTVVDAIREKGFLGSSSRARPRSLSRAFKAPTSRCLRASRVARRPVDQTAHLRVQIPALPVMPGSRHQEARGGPGDQHRHRPGQRGHPDHRGWQDRPPGRLFGPQHLEAVPRARPPQGRRAVERFRRRRAGQAAAGRGQDPRPPQRSREGASGLAAFDVEVIYHQKTPRFGTFGRRAADFPVPDIIVSQALWSVYLPAGYDYLRFGGSVEKEKSASGLRPILRWKRRTASRIEPAAPATGRGGAGGLQGPRPAPGRRDEKGVRRQAGPRPVPAGLPGRERDPVQPARAGRPGGRGGDRHGVLPIRVQIPTSGELYRFAETLVSGEPMTLSLTFVASGLKRLVLAFFLAAGALAVFSILRKSRRNRSRGASAPA